MIDLTIAPRDVKDLADSIGALSQHLFSADWHTGCELPIWQAMTDEDSAFHKRAEPELLRKLAVCWFKVGGWVVWDENFHRLMWLDDVEWFRMRTELGAVVDAPGGGAS